MTFKVERVARRVLLLLLLPLAACAGASRGPVTQGAFEPVSQLDLARFMGDWYVLAHIPTRPERDAFDALEQYTLREDGRIDIRFTFCRGAGDGPLETLEMLGWVHDRETNAEWRVRPFWPLRFGYEVLELAPDYSLTVIGHPSRRYAWIMARTTEIDEDALSGISARLAHAGFDIERLRRVPHSGGQCRAIPEGA